MKLKSWNRFVVSSQNVFKCFTVSECSTNIKYILYLCSICLYYSSNLSNHSGTICLSDQALIHFYKRCECLNCELAELTSYCTGLLLWIPKYIYLYHWLYLISFGGEKLSSRILCTTDYQNTVVSLRSRSF